RTEQARDDVSRRTCHCVIESGVPAHLDVSPVPRITQIGERLHVQDVDSRQWARRHGSRLELIRFQRDQGKPGTETISVRSCGCKQPWQVWRIELTAAKIVRLKVDGKSARLSANDMPRVDADHVSGPEHLGAAWTRLH